jgi:hypothetical protein
VPFHVYWPPGVLFPDSLFRSEPSLSLWLSAFFLSYLWQFLTHSVVLSVKCVSEILSSSLWLAFGLFSRAASW